ncbi:HAD-IG family 5'-nucleotidase [Anaeromyxobacter paludicola]|uniref:5' nucleotidase n=1 Tax=Anaeromyxobacter paludicola TaxID=2918171 RepID=A0ABN6N6D8_9BACT|nr:HAD-IG family 5'-nucleotidase [Anaeromyxobacter paludicola]BDG07559.1 5' nucleotidase [Anaeromyxobacter paludicola]
MATPPAPLDATASPGRAYDDPELQALLARPHPGHREVPRARQIFVNRNLRMDKVELVGFDMDYTLAIYQLRHLEELAFELTLARMVSQLGYPPAVGSIRYDAEFVIRGLVMDKQTGNIFKMDRHNHCGRCYHGRRPLPHEEMRRLYRDEKIHLSLPRFAWIDTLFALPEAALFAEIIELLEGQGQRVDYGKLYEDIRESIDTVHRDGTLKEIVKRDLARYLVKDLELGPALHKLRSGGKKLFLLTNSLADYTDAVMTHILDGVLPEYPSWRNYFDVVITGAGKPGFFADRRPLFEVGPDLARAGEARSLERGRLYEGGDLATFEKLVGIGGDRVLYVGDHIYGDILRTKRSSLWRTCMIVQELEPELAWLERNEAGLAELGRLEELRARVDDELSLHRTGLNALDRRLDREALPPGAREELDAERRQLKHELEQLRHAVRDANARIEALQGQIEEGYNRYWGLTFKEGNENSRFGEQIEDYACLYTSRVSNFVFYSPMQYFRSLRAAMPHERQGHRLNPYGDEHAPAVAGSRPSKWSKASR